MFFTGMTIFAKFIKSLWRSHTSHGILKQNRQKTQNTEKQKAGFLKEYVQNMYEYALSDDCVATIRIFSVLT